MKKECSVRLFLFGMAAAAALGALLGFFAGTKSRWTAYEERISLLRQQNERLLEKQVLQRREEAKDAAESLKMVKPCLYVLLEEDGYVTVYRADKKTLYSLTDIPVSSLPKELQEEVRQGKRIQNEEELYSFLENYSS